MRCSGLLYTVVASTRSSPDCEYEGGGREKANACTTGVLVCRQAQDDPEHVICENVVGNVTRPWNHNASAIPKAGVTYLLVGTACMMMMMSVLLD